MGVRPRGSIPLHQTGGTEDSQIFTARVRKIPGPVEALTTLVLRHHIDVMPTTLTRQVQRAITAAPCSIRALAREAGVPQSTLVRIQTGEREATLAVAKSIERALGNWGRACHKAAVSLRRTIDRKEAT